MGELVVKSTGRSAIRQCTETLLTVTFPLWGIGLPLSILMMVVVAISQHQQYSRSASGLSAASVIAFSALSLSCTVLCILAKRAISRDMFIVDKTGLQLPRLLGNRINFQTYIAWQDITRIAAAVTGKEPTACNLVITTKRGKPVHLVGSSLDSGFIEQLLMAANMWAPQVCDTSLQSLQAVLRTGTAEVTDPSYTALWEEELGRRFCPAAYITLEPGRVLRNCTLTVIRHLASGGLSSLYLCQLDGKKLVVLKESVIPEDSAENLKEKAAEMFKREVALLLALDHPGIVRVLDSFIENERNYTLLEYVDGSDLRQLVQQNGPRSESQVLEWAIAIASTLKYLHEREKPIIHRDLTPDNIVLRNDGQIIIVDFGAANEFIGNATGTFVGKHAFVAPEQLRGKATVQSDIYAFGCTLFFLLTGQEPEALMPSSPRLHNTAVSQDLSELVETCTQLDAADRYTSFAKIIPVLKGIAAQCVVL